MTQRILISVVLLALVGCELFTGPELSRSAVTMRLNRFELDGPAGGVIQYDAVQAAAHFEYYPPRLADEWVYVISSRHDYVRIPLSRARCRKPGVSYYWEIHCAFLLVEVSPAVDSQAVVARIAALGADVRWRVPAANVTPAPRVVEVTLFDARKPGVMRERIRAVSGVERVLIIDKRTPCDFCSQSTLQFYPTEVTAIRVSSAPIDYNDDVLQVSSGDTIRARHGGSRFPGLDVVFVVP